jgi:molybdopterin synthase catalytic subunit
MEINVAIATSPIHPDSEISHFMSHNDTLAGAVVSFCGVTRSDKVIEKTCDETILCKGIVKSLVYEAYVAMAESVMKSICLEAYESSGKCLRGVYIRHSVGTVSVGETSFLVIASSPHRSEAFSAVRFIVDNVKSRAPIWKRDVLDSNVLGPWRANCECSWSKQQQQQQQQEHVHKSNTKVRSPIAYRIVTQSEWQESLQCNMYYGSTLDIKDGYMHLSAPGSVRETALKYFSKSLETLLLLEVVLPKPGNNDDCFTKEGITLKWDWVESRGVDFPHLYPNRLPIQAVKSVHFLKSKDSEFFFGEII